jgi:hypothetical protein
VITARAINADGDDDPCVEAHSALFAEAACLPPSTNGPDPLAVLALRVFLLPARQIFPAQRKDWPRKVPLDIYGGRSGAAARDGERGEGLLD